MQQLNYTGWDIGGAHLKVATINQQGDIQSVTQYATPIWEGFDRLESILPKVLSKLPDNYHQHAITMTAELADIFTNREAGVLALRDLCGRYIQNEFYLYSEENGLINSNLTDANIHSVGSANWHASATFIASKINKGIFIDIGSSTTDILPFSDQKLLYQGHDDFTRLRFDELVYTGIVRTPLMALTNRVPFAGDEYGVAAELFATTADIYRILGLLDERVDMMKPADGGEKNVAASIKRLGRMIGADADLSGNQAEWQKLAQYFADKQLDLLSASLNRIFDKYNKLDKTIVAAGAGVFLIKQIAERFNCEVIEFNSLINCEQSLKDGCNLCAPAVALAELNRIKHQSR